MENICMLNVSDFFSSGIIIADNNCIIKWANKIAVNDSGYEIDEIIGNKIDIFESNVQDKKFYNEIWAKIRNGEIWKGELVSVNKNGFHFLEEMNIIPFVFNNESLFLILKQNILFDNIKNDTKEIFKQLFYTCPIPLSLCSPENLKVISVNESWSNFLKYKTDDILNKTLLDIGVLNYKNYNLILDLLEKNKEFNIEVNVRDNFGNIFNCINGGKLIQHDGKDCLLNFLFDNTQNKKDLIKLKKSKNDLIDQNDDLKDFTCIVGHDLKDPLRKILNFITLLKDENLDEKTRKYYFSIIEKSATKSIHLIDDLLNWSKVEKSHVDKSKINCRKCIDYALELLESKINSLKDKGKTIEFSYNSYYPEINGDFTLISLVYRNLISNALKFNENNNIKISFTYSSDSNHSFILGVKDNGIGITQRYLKQIFEHLKRLNSSEKFEGSGVGLSICKKIIEKHDGKIWASSRPDRGSHFKFYISN